MRPPPGNRGCRGVGRQRGFSLIAAIFLIVVLAALGAFAVRVAMTQYQTANVELLEARAEAAAQAGIGYGATMALQASNCASAALNLTPTGLAGFTVTVTCSATTHQAYSPVSHSVQTFTAYALTATASYGTYGQPDYVARTVSRNVTNAPP